MGDYITKIPGVESIFLKDILGTETPQEKAQREASEKATGLSDLIATITRDYYRQTAPLRESIIKRAGEILSGNYNPTESPLFGSMKKVVENVSAGTKENLMGMLPAGGTLESALATNEGNRAENLTDVMANLLQQEYMNAFGLGSSSVPTTLQGATWATAPLNTAVQANMGNLAANNAIFGVNDIYTDMSKYMGQGWSNLWGGIGGGMGKMMM
jgi:hypothetical protein